MHQKMAAALEECVLEIRSHQEHARTTGDCTRPRWPMIVLRSPKGGQGEGGGRPQGGGSWRAHQVRLPIRRPTHGVWDFWKTGCGATSRRSYSTAMESWLRNFGKWRRQGRTASPRIRMPMGMLRKELELPDFRDYAVKVKAPAGAMLRRRMFWRTILRR